MAIFQQKAITNLKLFRRRPISKLPAKAHAYFLRTLYELLTEGFSLNQALVFMELLMPSYQPLIHTLVSTLESGKGIEIGLRQIGYSLDIVAQLYYAQRQGRFYDALLSSADKLAKSQENKTKIIKALMYPCVMFIFLIALLLGMRLFLLPHIISFISQKTFDSNILVRVLILFFTYLPQLMLGGVGLVIVAYLFFDLYLMKQSYIYRHKLLLKVPIVRQWVRSYCTYKLADSLGHFIGGGFSIQQTIDFIVQYPIDPFLSELALHLQSGYQQGETLSDTLNQLQLFRTEFGMIVYQGELTSQLPTKCLVYASKILSDMLEDMAKKLTYLQPILFMVIAVMVMAMYLLMMLPMLTMEGL
ncbi:type II secretion system F family protein [Aerococcaceae bacterium zg-B36]|uniref:competence type IV pilus assembly protein ComGB n=1 Tax=Aerococcaceae bacterium zg-252 TaxID=2796928 RepID=UPI001BD89D93|nr:type II secretion system F family protein [Aerococcaceae bacterium zg-B36]